jgi:UDP-arabinose 4-epimerase
VNVLVTGGAGYIGSHTCKALAAAGYRPVTFDNLTLGHREVVRWGPLVVGDVLDSAALRSVLREHSIQRVIHFAASAYVGDSLRDPAAYYRNNVATTLSLLDAMREVGVRDLVFSSSCAVYGEPDRLPVDENCSLRPLSPYGQSKLDAENAIRWYARAYGMRALCLRYFNAAGADPDGEIGEWHDPETRLVPRAILAALGKGEALQVFGSDYATPDRTAIRDYVHVADLAAGHVAALNGLSPAFAGEPLNLGTGHGYSVRSVIEAVQRAVGAPVPHAVGPRRAGDPAEVVADARRATRELDWSPRHSDLDTIVTTASRWLVQLHRARSPAPPPAA